MRHRLHLSLVTIVLMACAPLVGCNSTPELDDAGQVAVRITELLKEVDSDISVIRNELRLASRDRRTPDVEGSLKRLKRAESNCREAKALSEESHSPRNKLAFVLHLIGNLYALDRELLNEKMEKLERAGRVPSDELLTARDEADRWMRQYFRESNDELDFLTRYMKLLAPKDVYPLRSVNHAYLDEWGQAAAVLREYIDSFKSHLSKDELLAYQEQIRRYEEMELRAADAGI